MMNNLDFCKSKGVCGNRVRAIAIAIIQSNVAEIENFT